MSKTNPFSLEAVAVFGNLGRHCRDLQYVHQPDAELVEYLKNYPVTDRRYGGGIGLRGGHGSGKTHLLTWLASRARESQWASAVVLYGKIDRASFFDLYVQFLTDLTRKRIQEIIGDALRNIALEEVQSARATESLGKRIKVSDDLVALYKDGNLSEEKIRLELRHRMEKRLEQDVPPALPRMCLEVDNAVTGEKCFEWLKGGEVADLDSIGVTQPLRAIGLEQSDSSTPDLAAINALETLAALHHLAGRPLIVLVDQLEVLIRTNPERQQAVYSIIKKLIEQLKRQNALVFMAGNEESWESLTRDVFPRLRNREPLQVGNLTEGEITALLQAYLGDHEQFPAALMSVFHRLSGGNTREVLRIAYHAYKATDGQLTKVNEEMLRRGAMEGGSLSDRRKLALSILDRILNKEMPASEVVQELVVPDGGRIDRLVRIDKRPQVAVVVLTAADRVQETQAAQNVEAAHRYLEQNWPGIRVVVVAVGYSSDDVRRVLAKPATVIEFQESDFAGRFRTVILETSSASMPARPPAPGPAGPPGPQGPPGPTVNPELLQTLSQVREELHTLLEARKSADVQAKQAFSQATESMNEPARRQRELETRWDLIAELDDLAAMIGPYYQQFEQERMRAVLVANEARLGNSRFEFLGSVYLDLVALQQTSWWRPWDDKLAADAGKLKMDLFTEMKKVLRPDERRDWLKPWLGAIVGAIIGVAVVAIPSLLSSNPAPRYGVLTITGLICAGAGYGLLEFRKRSNLTVWEWRLEELRKAVMSGKDSHAPNAIG